MVTLLLKYGAPIDAVNSEGGSPLLLACMNGDNRTIECLLDYGADTQLENGTGKISQYLSMKEMQQKMEREHKIELARAGPQTPPWNPNC
jgi:ankyrin repeat protein